MKDLHGDMVKEAKDGKSPICAVEKRLAAGKLQTYNLAKKFGMLPKDTTMEEFMSDTNDFWTKDLTGKENAAGSAAQTGATALLDAFGLPIIC